jgi:hypothetical protein
MNQPERIALAFEHLAKGFDLLGHPVKLMGPELGFPSLMAVLRERKKLASGEQIDLDADAWLRISVHYEHALHSALVTVDFKAGPMYWLEIAKKLDEQGAS